MSSSTACSQPSRCHRRPVLVEAGVNLIDTADAYSNGQSEEMVIELEHSLRRLGVDQVDLYQVHRWDPTTSDETPTRRRKAEA